MDDCDWLLSVEKACDWLRIEPGVTVNFFLGHPVVPSIAALLIVIILSPVVSQGSFNKIIKRVTIDLQPGKCSSLFN